MAPREKSSEKGKTASPKRRTTPKPNELPSEIPSRPPAPVQSVHERTAFDPAIHGFRFSNRFQNHRFIGPIHINLDGRCGGMVYAALDFFLAEMQIPPDTTLPPEGSVLSTYISERQDNSIMATVDLWAERIFNPFGWRTAEFFHWGLPSQQDGQFTRIRASVDRQRPVPLGLFAPGSGGFAAHHQVLAIGYDFRPGHNDELRIMVYDPNYPGAPCVIRPHLTQLRYFETTPSGSLHEWLTYFADYNYRPKAPDLSDPCAGTSFRDWSGQQHTGRTYNRHDFRCGRFVATNFTGATMMQTDFGRSNGARATFYGANIRNSNFANANLREAIFYGADLKTTSMVAVDATRANFVGADLQTANLEGGVFDEANFHGADLNHTNLKGARFRSANLFGADLRNATLDNADLTGATLTRARLDGISRRGTIGLP